MFKRNSPRMLSRCSDANNGIRPNDGERLASLRKQLADPTQNHPVDDQKWHPTGPASSQHDDLLPQHRDLGFQRRARSEQIDDNPKNYSAEIQHPAEDHPILRLTPTGWNLRQGQRSVTIADQFGAEQRTKSVGCNQTLARKRAAIRGSHRDAVATIFEAVHHGVGHKFNRISIPASIEQHIVQIDAVRGSGAVAKIASHPH